MKSMSESAMKFAERYEMYCIANGKSIKVRYDSKSRSWKPALETLMDSMSDDVFLHEFMTGDTDDVVRARMEIVLCRAAEAEDDQPTIFPMPA